MTLLVRCPDTYLVERRYVLDVVLGEWLGLDYELTLSAQPGVSIRLRGDPLEREIRLPDVLFSTPMRSWLTQEAAPARPLAWLTVAGDEANSEGQPLRTLPAIYGTTTANGLASQRVHDGISISIDILGSAFYMLTRSEELASKASDTHGRFPANGSLAAREGFLERPIVDEYVELLSSAVHALWPGLGRRPTQFRLAMTHDVDRPWAVLGRRFTDVGRALAADIVRRHDPRLALRRGRAFIETRAGRVDHDPENSFDFLMDTSERLGLRDTFYFMTGEPAGTLDARRFRGYGRVPYRISDPPVVALLRRVMSRGHEVGLHASYDSYLSAERLHSELQVLIGACRTAGFDQPAWGVRQHFLRFRNPDTWRHQESAGLAHDSTLGFADQIGFRAGTCREYPLFDVPRRRRLELRERPLVVMDTTLFEYLAVPFDEAACRVKSIVGECRRHGGSPVLLFHNDGLTGPRRRAHYRDLVGDLAQG